MGAIEIGRGRGREDLITEMPLVAAEVSTFLCGRFGNLTSSGLVSRVPNLNGKING